MPFKFDPDAYFSNGVSEDLFRMMVGDRLGSGLYRDVYDFSYNPNYVIKIETDSKSFANIREWEVWQSIGWDEKMKKWFAPCFALSPRGQFLIQEKTSAINPGYKLPKKIPALFDDLHMGNWGILNKRIVCHDYANNKAFSAITNLKMVEANWRIDE